MSNLPTVVVAMSGGVDSSVAATLLVEQGYPVIGMMLRLWSEEGKEESNRCCTPDAMAQARRVAAQLVIPFYAIDAQSPFREKVVGSFLGGYSAGGTPNPCIICNRSIRWGFLLERARALGADYLATGHYARIQRLDDGTVQLMKAVDEQKDQSYVLSGLSQEQLASTIFPLGELTKPEVRKIAREHRLVAAERADSQDLCFLAGQDYRNFLARFAPQTLNPGPIRNRAGEQVGEHQGLAFYTIGQRKGLGISSAEPLYVLEKVMERNELVVGTAEELGKTELVAGPVNWISGEAPVQPIRAQVKIRYKAKPAEATILPAGSGRVRVQFDYPIRDITPGQLAAFYQDDLVLGGGLILS